MTSIKITCTKHTTCRDLAGLSCSGFAIPTLESYYGGKPVGMAGMERAGAYKGQLNLIGGKAEAKDGGCVLKAMRREVKEEMKWKIVFGEDFDKVFRKKCCGRRLKTAQCPKCGKTRGLRYVVHKRTVVFVAVMPAGTSRKTYNAKISKALQDPTLPHCEKEMSKVEWVDLNGACLSNANDTVSSFAQAVFRKVRDEHFDANGKLKA